MPLARLTPVTMAVLGPAILDVDMLFQLSRFFKSKFANRWVIPHQYVHHEDKFESKGLTQPKYTKIRKRVPVFSYKKQKYKFGTITSRPLIRRNKDKTFWATGATHRIARLCIQWVSIRGQFYDAVPNERSTLLWQQPEGGSEGKGGKDVGIPLLRTANSIWLACLVEKTVISIMRM